MKLGSKTGSHMVDLLFTLALFCVFAASALMVVLIGANVYKNTVRQTDASFSGRTSLTYVATKIRQNDIADGIHLEERGGTTALVLDQPVEGEIYQTWIYFHDGALRETFTQQGNDFAMSGGQAIIQLAEFRIEQAGDTLVLTTVDAEGNASSQSVTPRCGLQS